MPPPSGSASGGQERNLDITFNTSVVDYIPCIIGAEHGQCPPAFLSGFALFLSLAIVSTSLLSITLIRRSDKLWSTTSSRMLMYISINNLIFTLISSPFNMCQWTRYLYITPYLCQIHATFFLISAGILLILMTLINYDNYRAAAHPCSYYGKTRRTKSVNFLLHSELLAFV